MFYSYVRLSYTNTQTHMANENENKTEDIFKHCIARKKLRIRVIEKINITKN